MNENREWDQLKKEYQKIKIPENGPENMRKAIEKAEKEKAARRRSLLWKKTGTGLAAALVLGVLIPNISVEAALAMEKIPVIGGLVRVVTFGRYDYEDERHEARVEIPKVELTKEEPAKEEQPADIPLQPAVAPEQPASDAPSKEDGDMKKAAGEAVSEAAKQSVDSLNKEVEDYIGSIVEDFKAELKEDYVKTLNISYEVVTDSDDWFTLRIDVLEIQASGYMYSKYYHIDKTTGEQAALKDLFRPEADYIGAISENIKEQMRSEMEADEGRIYFIDNEDMPEDNFDRIKENQNFYFNEKGEIVIAFDEYEVAPGYMGPVQFTVPGEVTEGLLK